MILPSVWSERRTKPPWTQCSECGYLMGLRFAGFTAFPHGANSDAERDAFTATEIDRAAHRAAGDPMFPLLNDAAMRRYGVRLRPIALPRANASQLRAMLLTQGIIVVLPGSYAKFPAGHRLRRWQRSYVLGHIVAAVALGGGRLHWLDPLAPMGYAGEPASVDEAMLFAWTPSDAHFAGVRELEDHDVINDYLMGLEEVPNRRAVIGGGATARSAPAFSPQDYNAGRLFALAPDRQSSATMLGWVQGTNLTLRDGSVFDPGTRWFVTRNDDHGICFWHEHDLVRLDPIEIPDCSAEVTAATAALQNKLGGAATAVDGAAQAIAAAQRRLK